MKTRTLLLTSITLVTSIFISFTVIQSSLGPHNGTVKPAGDYNIEIKNSYPVFYAYLLDKKMKPISNKKIFCEARFVLPDSTNINISLKPYAEDGFSAEINTIRFNSCRIYFNVSGKSVSAVFENENPIVEKK